ncbi:MAG: GHKL domain-containing protein, partial [Clostridiaceae bacterium]|nr:GHKL domain-containing protein [Clostridiaceae bacterium]
KKLKLIVTISSDTQIIVADSKYFIRVFDNLLNNIQRYALPDTRIYLDVITYDPDVINIRISNVSAEKINVSAEQLMERFVQGDSSRNHEGSGIGLAIAKSLMEAQNGSMQIKVNDDLFTVDLKIPKYLPKSIDSDELY